MTPVDVVVWLLVACCLVAGTSGCAHQAAVGSEHTAHATYPIQYVTSKLGCQVLPEQGAPASSSWR